MLKIYFYVDASFAARSEYFASDYTYSKVNKVRTPAAGKSFHRRTARDRLMPHNSRGFFGFEDRVAERP